MKYIAIIGFGVVGGGITAVIEENREKIKKAVGDDVSVKYILDLRDFPDSPYADRIVHDIAPIVEDGEIELVCETMGGSHPALEFSLACMNSGKSVVTSNKEVVANFGDVLLECARKNGVEYLFEASVGGGIPVLRSFATSLAGDNIVKINGIVNGTTNFILTKMKEDKRTFDDVLAEAQQLGYAERDPSADIDAIDAQRKIIILTALATGSLLNADDVYRETLRNVSLSDMEAARKLDGEVKLIAEFESDGSSVSAFACPMIVPHAHPLSGVSGVYNAISVTSAITGDVMFYGRGAGRFPTAGAVAADVTAILSGAAKAELRPDFKRAEGSRVKKFEDIEFKYYVRAESAGGLREKLDGSFDNVEILSDCGGVIEFVTSKADKKTLDGVLSGVAVESVIRIME